MKPTKNRVYCIGCRHPKMLFETQAKADNFIKFNRDEIASLSGKVPSRSYYCSFCCAWHVTSVDNEGEAVANDIRDKKLGIRLGICVGINSHKHLKGKNFQKCLFSSIA